MKRLRILSVATVVGGLLSGLALAVGTLGVPPESAWHCPKDQPVKGNFTTQSGEPCIYHVPGGAFYEKTKPERCYATEDDARADGCRKSSR